DKGRKELETTKKIISKIPNITLVAREKTSYDLMQRYFPDANIILTPDIVLSMNLREPLLKREGALMVLRTDAEKILTDEQSELLDVTVHKYFDHVLYADMHYHRKVSGPRG